MNTLIVYAHEEPRSFNAAMKNTAIKTLEELGHHVVVSDLYRMKFKAVADRDDFLQCGDPVHLKRQAEEKRALELGTLSHDLVLEQRKLLDADLVILQFPLWWFSMPAIMKGWVDRVMAMGFAYGGGKWYDQGGLKGRKAMLSLTTGGPEAGYSERGINGPMDRILYPIQHGILFFCGLEVLPPFVAYGPAHQNDGDRDATLERFRRHLRSLETMAPIPFHTLADYDERMQLKAGLT